MKESSKHGTDKSMAQNKALNPVKQGRNSLLEPKFGQSLFTWWTI